MTPFLPLNKFHRGRSPSRWTLYLLLGALVLAVFGGFLLMHLLGGVALSVGAPFWRLREVSVNAWNDFTVVSADKVALTHERDVLQTQTNLLSARLADYQQLLGDNIALRARLGRRDTAMSSALVARVLTGWPGGPFDILTLDLGRNNSVPVITVGAAVLADSGVWLGRVAEVYGNTSKVQLLSLAGNDLPALLGPRRVPIVLHGRGGGNFITAVPRGVAVMPGEVALASGPDRDWVVAVVGAVTAAVNQTNDTVYLRQPVNARELEYVVIQEN